MQPVLTNFRAVSPAHGSTQTRSFDWLASAHARAEATRAEQSGVPFNEKEFRQRVAKLLGRFGCGPEKIEQRGHEIPDCEHTRWNEMDVYRLEENPNGLGAFARTELYDQATYGILQRIFAEAEVPPNDLLHVTCTGYASPSAAQRLVADRGWGHATRVTHAYHMGCYAAFPALRMASAFLSVPRRGASPEARRTEVVHTEICSLHVNPLQHTPEQLVVQTLFADGFIAYTVQDAPSWDRRAPALSLVYSDEVILPASANSMTWTCSEFGMQMSLARDVPERIASEIANFVEGLCEGAGLAAAARSEAIFAIHPGGPKILDRARDALGAREETLTYSRKVLRERGNMSSATLPHVWMEMARSEEVSVGRPIVSLAFGPGLTMCGAVLAKAG